MENKLDVWVNTDQLAKHFGVTRQAIYLWRKKPGFPYENISPKITVYNIQKVKDFLGK